MVCIAVVAAGSAGVVLLAASEERSCELAD